MYVVALHTSVPEDHLGIPSHDLNEAKYDGYVRQHVESLEEAVFPRCNKGTEHITHFSVSQDGTFLDWGPVNPSILMSPEFSVQPILRAITLAPPQAQEEAKTAMTTPATPQLTIDDLTAIFAGFNSQTRTMVLLPQVEELIKDCEKDNLVKELGLAHMTKAAIERAEKEWQEVQK